jgi:hypothetical protein
VRLVNVAVDGRDLQVMRPVEFVLPNLLALILCAVGWLLQ